MTIQCCKSIQKCNLFQQCFFYGKWMKIMLVMTNYAKGYASTIYQSLVSSYSISFTVVPVVLCIFSAASNKEKGKPQRKAPLRYRVWFHFHLKRQLVSNNDFVLARLFYDGPTKASHPTFQPFLTLHLRKKREEESAQLSRRFLALGQTCTLL